MKEKITLNERKSKIALILLLTILMQIFMPIFTGMSEVYAETTETLLTTITATGKEQASYSVENVVSVSFSYTTDGSSAYYNNGKTNWGWWGYGWTATVTPADGYTITKCVFYDDKDRTATDSEAPFVVETTDQDKVPRVNGTPILAYQSKGITKIEVYGYVQSKTATITLNTNGGTINTGNITEYEEGTGATLPTDVTREGYIFLGWYDNENLTGSAVTSISTTDTGDKTFYAKWVENLVGNIYKDNIAINYWIKIKDKNNDTAILNAGTHSFTIEKRTSDNEFLVRINGNKLYISGDITKDAIGIEITGGSGTNADPYTLGIAYTTKSSVILDTNGGTINSGNITEYTEGTGATLPTDVTKDGYTFEGWFASSDFSEDAVTEISTTETGDKKYWAKWNENPPITNISFENVTKTYNGNEYTINVTGNLVGGTIKYGTTEGTYDLNELPKYTNAGTYLIYYKATKDGYKDKVGSATLIINKAELTIPTLSDTDKTYTGEEQEPTINGYDSNTMSQSGDISATNVGNYTISWNLKDTTNYQWSDSTNTEKSANWSISNATIPVTFADNEVTYNGEEYSINVTGTLAGGTIEYSTNGTDYSETLPTYINAGTYTIYYRANKSGFSDKTGSATLTINKADYDMSNVKFENAEYTYDGIAKSITATNLPTGVTATYEGNAKTEVGTYIVTAKFIGDSNHNEIADKTATLTIKEKQTPPTPPVKEEGKVEVVEPETPNANNAKVADTPDELISKIEFTEEDIQAKEDGKNIDIYIEVSNIDETVSNEDKTKIEGSSKIFAIGTYLDINLFKKIEGEDAVKITSTKQPIKVSFEIPESLRKEGRIFYIFKLHDGELSVLTTDVKDNTLTFETDEFSTYALAYRDYLFTVNIEGLGYIGYAVKGDTLPVAEDQSAGEYTVEGTEYVIIAKADDGYKFVKWTKNGEDYSTDLQTNVIVNENTEMRAVFEYIEETTENEDNNSDGEEVNQEGTKQEKTENETKTNSPKTGDNIVYYITMFVISLLGIVAIFIKGKKLLK